MKRDQPRREKTAVEPTRLTIRDLADEAISSMMARPARAALTTLGTMLGVAAFVAVLGLTASASGQIDRHFTALQATQVTVTDDPQNPQTADLPFTPDAEARAHRLVGVNAAGIFWPVQTPPKAGQDGNASAQPPSVGGSAIQTQIYAASPGLFSTIHARLATGRTYDDYAESALQRVCVLGAGAAHQLGITRVDDGPAVFIDGVPFTVMGIIADTQRMPELLVGILVPDRTVLKVWGRPDPANGTPIQMLIDTRLGAAALVGHQAPLALRPDDSKRFQVTVPPNPRQLRQQVNTDLSTLFLGLAGICLVIGAIGIANTTLVAVLERVGEIGLRRSLGARRRHISAHFLAESATLGLVGGLAGTSVGVLAVVATAYSKNWTPIIAPATVLPAPLVGAITGLLAGLYPAWRAAKIEPADALRR